MPVRELPKYQSHKKVWALKIKTISQNRTEAGAMLGFEEDGYGAIPVSAEYISKHSPCVGGYFVIYDDGYRSFSPAKAFEEGYTRVGGSAED